MKDPPSEQPTPQQVKYIETKGKQQKPFVVYRRVNSNRVISVIRRREFDPITMNDLNKMRMGNKKAEIEQKTLQHKGPSHKPSLSLSAGRSSSTKKSQLQIRRELGIISDNNGKEEDKNGDILDITKSKDNILPILNSINKKAEKITDSRRSKSLVKNFDTSQSLSNLKIIRNQSNILLLKNQFPRKIY